MANITGIGENGKVLYVTELAARLDAALDQIEALLDASGSPTWAYWEAFTAISGQADYLWGTGTQHEGTIEGDAQTEAHSAIVQWGVTVLIPYLDYTILADRLRLTNTFSAEQAAKGEPLTVRVRRSA